MTCGSLLFHSSGNYQNTATGETDQNKKQRKAKPTYFKTESFRKYC